MEHNTTTTKIGKLRKSEMGRERTEEEGMCIALLWLPIIRIAITCDPS
jgi:hypothetical protein